MKRFFAASALTAILFTGCAGETSTVGFESNFVSTQQQPPAKIKIATTFYPLYEIAKQVGGDYVDIKNLVPPGAEPHDYELTPKDVADVYDSQILVVNGAGVEPWLDKLLPDFEKQPNLHVVDEAKNFSNLMTGFHEEGEPAPTPQEEAISPSYDPHIWMEPTLYAQEVAAFEKTMETVDPAHKDYYSANAQSFNAKLTDLDQKFKNGLQNCTLREFVTNHAAFGYLSKRYNLSMIAIAGLSPDAEPSSKTLAGLVDLIKQKNIHYILTESLVSPKIADTLAQETGAQTMILNPLEGLTDEELAQGKNYLSVMEENLKTLQTALECK